VGSLLVTGAAGFIGANFVHYWVGRHPSDSLVVLDALTYAGNRASLQSLIASGRVKFVQGDIGTPGLAAGLLRTYDISTLVHFAAESHVDRSIAGPDDFIRTNVAGTHELLKGARQVWLEEQKGKGRTRFHHISTDEVYGSLGTSDAPVSERARYAPSSPYAASKAAADHLVRAYHHTYDLPVSTTNCSNNYGPFQFPEKLIPLMLVHILDGKPLPVYGDGLHVRDWLYVEDHCRAIDLVIESASPGETYNVGGGNQWQNIDIVRLLCGLVDEAFDRDRALVIRFPSAPMSSGQASETLIGFVEDRPGHDRRYAIDASKIQRELGFQPYESFETGIRKTVSWYLDHEPWWRGVIDGSYSREKE
jgi:dTDP-glucose 4,6-dehydratase